MPNLVPFRSATTTTATRPDAPAPSRRPVVARRDSTGWRDRATAWLRSTAAALGPKEPGDPAVAQLAELAALARDPDEVRVALVRLAAEVSGADRVELSLDRGGRPARRLAHWPPSASPEPVAEAGCAPRGPIARAVARARSVRPAWPTLTATLKAGEVHFGTLRLTSSGRRPWPAGAARRLATLCAIAASAERALAAPAAGQPEPGFDPELGPRGSTTLGAFLAFALAQARRRREPLSLLEVAVDRLAALRELLGEELAEVALDRVARAVKATVRASDVLTRLEDGRLAVILPNASAENAMRVAEAVRSAIARVGAASTTMPALSASIGVATYPEHAHDLVTLRAAAATALTRAGALGYDRTGEADAVPAAQPAG